jgi:hypothetical protein
MCPTSGAHNHAFPGTQISASTWARRDPSSDSLTRLREHRSSIRTSRSSRYVLTVYFKNRAFSFLNTHHSFYLRDDRNASPAVRVRLIRRTRRVSLAHRAPPPAFRDLRLARPMLLPPRPILLLKLARPVPPPLPPRPIPLLSLARPMPVPPQLIPLLKLAQPIPVRLIPLKRARPMPLRPIPLPRLARLTPLRHPVQSVITTLPEQYDTAHDLHDHILLKPALPLISIPNFELIKSDIYYFM